MSLQVWLPLTGDLRNQGLSDANITTSVTFTDNGKIGGKCLSSTTGWFSVPEMDNKKQMSFAYWVKINAGTTTNWLDTFTWKSTNGSSDSTNRQEFYYYSSDSETMTTGVWYPGNSNSGYSNQKIGEWNHYTFTIDYESRITKVYINGILKKTTTNVTEGYYIKDGASFCLRESSLNSSINDFRLYDHVLSDKEVEEISRGLVLHYKLDNNGLGNPNILTGTYYNSYKSELAAGTTARNIDGKWAAGSGGNGTFSVTEDSTCPVGRYSWNVLNNTSGNRDFQQGDQPYVSGQVYTTSFWAKGNGTCLYRSWNTTDGKQMFQKTWTLTENWVYYTHTFTASAEMETDSCTFHLGVTGNASISICGMKMELGNKATPYSLAIGEMTEENIIYDSSGYQNNGESNFNISTNTDTARYFTSSYFGEYNTPNIILQDPSILSSLNNCTICWWGKYDTTKTLLLTGQSTSVYLAASNNNTFYHAAAGSPIMYKNGVQGTYKCVAGSWDFYVLKNVNLSTWTTMKINGYGSGWPLKGLLSDFRIYATELTDEQILELYHTSMTIDNKGNIYSRELVE